MIIAIETSHTPGSVCLQVSPVTTGKAQFDELCFPPGLVHGRELFPHLDALLQRHSLTPAELAVIAVSFGPGSYTGVRIGVAAAKALAWALKIPALGISTLEVIARNVPESAVEGDFAVMLDARRGHCYGGVFRWEGDSLEQVVADCCIPPAEFLQQIGDSMPIVGETADRFCADAERLLSAEYNVPRALNVATSARSRVDRILSGDLPAPVEYHDPHRLVPNYMRSSEAEERAASKGNSGKKGNSIDAPATGMGGD